MRRGPRTRRRRGRGREVSKHFLFLKKKMQKDFLFFVSAEVKTSVTILVFREIAYWTCRVSRGPININKTEGTKPWL